MAFKKVNLSDKKLFQLGIGTRITEKELFGKKKGEYPIYSANIFFIFGWTDKLLDIDFKSDSVIWGIDGDWSTRYIKKGGKFYPTDHCGFLKCKDDLIDLEYLTYAIYIKGQELGFSRTYRPSIERMREISISIPVCENEIFDLQTQRKIAEKHRKINSFLKRVDIYISQLRNAIIVLDKNTNLKVDNIELEEIVIFPSIKGITEKFLNDNKGDVPVYGGRKDGNPKGYVKDNLKCLKYFSNCFSWNRNGSTGYVFYRSKKFSTTDDHRPMVLKEKYENVFDIEFLRLSIQKAILSAGFSWKDKAGKNKLKDILIQVPIKDDGTFDLDMQKNIAKKYAEIERKRLDVIDMLKQITDVDVVLNL